MALETQRARCVKSLAIQYEAGRAVTSSCVWRHLIQDSLQASEERSTELHLVLKSNCQWRIFRASVGQLGRATSFSNFHNFYPCIAHNRVSQLGRTTSLSNFYPCMAHKRVSQLGRATSFSRFYNCMARKRVSQLGIMATSFSKIYPCIAHQRVSQVGMNFPFSKFYPCVAHTKG